MDDAVASWSQPQEAGHLPPVGIVVLQLITLRTIRTALLQAASKQPGPYTAPDDAAAARRGTLAIARASSSSALADHRLCEVMELALAAQGQPVTEIAVDHAKWLYRDAAKALASASQHLRQHIQPPRAARPRPTTAAAPAPDKRNAAARLRTSLRLPFRKDRAPNPAPPAPKAVPPAPRRR
ncbi:hypothetical protein AB0I39_07910 [Kitasatospora purpeofusca]|uniref:hypothetical protein n=1 Tax=Kitasatospora purpeofusca TaxID=67352 RepID=UPI0033F35966